MTTYPATSTGALRAGFGVIAVGFVVALATNIAIAALSPAKAVFLLGGFALLIPTLVVKDAKAYWLFLLVLSIPFDISKWLSDEQLTQSIIEAYGFPVSGTVNLEIYITDVILAAMVFSWLARVSLRREAIYIPRVGYLFIMYLVWSLFVSMLNARSIYLSLFELCRQGLYFLSFLYLVNDITTGFQLRSAVRAIFLALIIGAGTVIVFFEMGIGTDTVTFASLHDQPAETRSVNKKGDDTVAQTLNVTSGGHDLVTAYRNQDSKIKRSQGMFRHPGIAAGVCGLTLPIVLAYLVSSTKFRHRALFSLIYIFGLSGLLLTFSRAGLIGLVGGTLVFFAVAGRSGLISRRAFRRSIIASILAIAVSTPLLTVYIGTRPEAFYMRFNMFEVALRGYSEHPFLGVGLNNGTASMKEARQDLKDFGVQIPKSESADSYYLAILTEIGPLGAILFLGFFFQIGTIAIRAASEVAAEYKPLLAGMIAGLSSIAIQSLADGPAAGHAVSAMVWLFAALIVVIARGAPSERRLLSTASRSAQVGRAPDDQQLFIRGNDPR